MRTARPRRCHRASRFLSRSLAMHPRGALGDHASKSPRIRPFYSGRGRLPAHQLGTAGGRGSLAADRRLARRWPVERLALDRLGVPSRDVEKLHREESRLLRECNESVFLLRRCGPRWTILRSRFTSISAKGPITRPCLRRPRRARSVTAPACVAVAGRHAGSQITDDVALASHLDSQAWSGAPCRVRWSGAQH